MHTVPQEILEYFKSLSSRQQQHLLQTLQLNSIVTTKEAALAQVAHATTHSINIECSSCYDTNTHTYTVWVLTSQECFNGTDVCEAIAKEKACDQAIEHYNMLFYNC